MTPLSCRVATTQRELDDALRIRWAVFGAELGLLGSTIPPAPREDDSGFRRFSLPLVAALDELPARPRMHLESLNVRES